MPINIFGFELGRKKTITALTQLEGESQPIKSFIPPDTDDGASVIDYVGGHGFGIHVLNYDTTSQNDGEMIAKYRQMAEHSETQTAIEDIVNQAIVLNDKNEPVSLNLDKTNLSDSVKKKIQTEYADIMRLLHFSTKGNDLFRRWYIDGRLYMQILMDEKKQKKGIVEIRTIDPARIKKVRNIEREVNDNGIKYIKKIQEFYIYTADDYVSNGKNSVNYSYTSDGIMLAPDSVAYINSGFLDQGTRKVLGYLHKAIKPLNQLRMLEDAIIIYRISRAPERRIFYIDVGSLPKNKSEQYIRDIMNRYKNKLVYDTQTGEMRDDKRHMSMLEDFWMPRREGGKGTEITTLPGGQNLGELQDVEYFRNKLFESLHVPSSRFKTDAGFNMGKTAEISRDEVRFAKFVNRLQSRFSDLFLQLLRVQLVAKNIFTEDEWKEYSYDMSFDFATDQYFAELKESEMKLSRFTILREADPYIGKFLSQRWVNSNILQLTDEEMEIMKKEMEEEAAAAAPPPEEAAPMEEPPLEAEDAMAPIEDMGMEQEEGESMEELGGVMDEMEGETSGTNEDESMNEDEMDELLKYYDEEKKSNRITQDMHLITENTIVRKQNKPMSPFGKKVLKAAFDNVTQKRKLDI